MEGTKKVSETSLSGQKGRKINVRFLGWAFATQLKKGMVLTVYLKLSWYQLAWNGRALTFSDLTKYEIKYSEVTRHILLVGLCISKHLSGNKCQGKDRTQKQGNIHCIIEWQQAWHGYKLGWQVRRPHTCDKPLLAPSNLSTNLISFMQHIFMDRGLLCLCMYLSKNPDSKNFRERLFCCFVFLTSFPSCLANKWDLKPSTLHIIYSLWIWLYYSVDIIMILVFQETLTQTRNLIVYYRNFLNDPSTLP